MKDNTADVSGKLWDNGLDISKDFCLYGSWESEAGRLRTEVLQPSPPSTVNNFLWSLVGIPGFIEG